MIRVYLDTNLVSGIRKQDLGAEQEPLRRLLIAHKQGTLELVTSPVTQEEIQRLPAGGREPHDEIYSLLTDVPVAAEEPLTVVGPVTAGPGLKGPIPTTDKDLAALRDILPDDRAGFGASEARPATVAPTGTQYAQELHVLLAGANVRPVRPRRALVQRSGHHRVRVAIPRRDCRARLRRLQHLPTDMHLRRPRIRHIRSRVGHVRQPSKSPCCWPSSAP